MCQEQIIQEPLYSLQITFVKTLYFDLVKNQRTKEKTLSNVSDIDKKMLLLYTN